MSDKQKSSEEQEINFQAMYIDLEPDLKTAQRMNQEMLEMYYQDYIKNTPLDDA